MIETAAAIAAPELAALLASGEHRVVGGAIVTEAEYLAMIDAELDAYFGTEGDASPTEIDTDEHSDTLPEPGR